MSEGIFFPVAPETVALAWIPVVTIAVSLVFMFLQTTCQVWSICSRGIFRTDQIFAYYCGTRARLQTHAIRFLSSDPNLPMYLQGLARTGAKKWRNQFLLT